MTSTKNNSRKTHAVALTPRHHEMLTQLSDKLDESMASIIANEIESLWAAEFQKEE